jgi:hypothetical protein
MLKSRQISRFKPKSQPPRYYEPTPEQAAPTDEKPGSEQDESMADVVDVEGNESGYVLDTYIRMPAEMFELEHYRSVGLLVLDSQPDLDEFYNDDSDDESEMYDEEEDENGLLIQSTNKIYEES